MIGANESLNGIMAHAGDGHAFGIAMIDLDRFKDINDIHGHQAGDAAISEVSVRLMAAIGHRIWLPVSEETNSLQLWEAYRPRTIWRYSAGVPEILDSRFNRNTNSRLVGELA